MFSEEENLSATPHTSSGCNLRSEELAKTDCQSIYLRIKPTSAEPSKAVASSFTVQNNQILLATNQKHLSKPTGHKYTFTKIFDETVKQEEFFHGACFSSLSDFINGDNRLLFAYGASNSGKTYTIQGKVNDPGVIPQSLNVLFNTIRGRISSLCRYIPDKVCSVVEIDDRMVEEMLSYKRSILNYPLETSNSSISVYSSKSTLTQMSDDSLDQKKDATVLHSNTTSEFISETFRDMQQYLSNTTVDIAGQGEIAFSVWVSFAEIYNECIYDLLDVLPRGQKRRQLTLGETAQKDVYIKGLRHILVTSGDEAYQMFLFGQHNLRQAPTNVNLSSSRSHSIFSIVLVGQFNINNPLFARVSKCSFVDLAGAERAKKTCNVGERMKESQNINTSLHVLGRCLETIRNNQHSREKRIIPFRESKLTRLFQRALSAKEVITMIVNVNLSSSSYEETVSVLKFSAIAQQIVFDPSKLGTTPRPASRFSQYAMQSLNASRLRCGTPPSFQSSISASFLSGDYGNYTQNESLLPYIEKLKQQLKEQRQINSTLEVSVRQDMYIKFSAMLERLETSWRNRLKDCEDRMEEHSEWRVNRLQEYYEQEHHQKSMEDTKNSRAEDLEDELSLMKQQVSSLEQGLKESKDYVSKLLTGNSELQLELASTKLELIDRERLLEASQQSIGTDSEEHMLVQELRKQLAASQVLLQEKDGVIKNTNELLQEAQVDYLYQIEQHELSETMKQEQEMTIALKDEELDDLKSQLLVCHSKISQLCAALDHRSEEETEILDKNRRLLEERDEYKSSAFNYEVLNKKLEKENEELKSRKQSREFKLCDMDIRDFETRILDLQDELKISKDKCKEAENRIKTLELEILSLRKEPDASTIQASHDREVTLLHKEIKALLKVKDELTEKSKEWHTNEKELKSTMKALSLTGRALEEEKKNVRSLEMTLQAQVQASKLHKQTYEDTKVFMSTLKEEMERRNEINSELEIQNKNLLDQIKHQETDFENFKTRRDHQFKVYEDMLKQEREGREMEKREVHRFQEVFTKTPTPNKMEYLAEISKLKDELTEKRNDLKKAKVMNSQLEKQIRVLTKSSEENKEVPSRRTTRSRAVRDLENVDPLQGSKDQDVADPKATNREKGKSRRRKLFHVPAVSS